MCNCRPDFATLEDGTLVAYVCPKHVGDGMADKDAYTTRESSDYFFCPITGEYYFEDASGIRHRC